MKSDTPAQALAVCSASHTAPEATAVGSGHDETLVPARAACVNCAVGCHNLSPAEPHLRAQAMDSGSSITAPTPQALLLIVLWLFGLPLLGLCCVVAVLQRLGFDQQPLSTFAVLSLVGWVGFRMLKRHLNQRRSLLELSRSV